MNATRIIAAGLLVSVLLVAGCDKKVQITVHNHTELTRTVQLSTPDETMTVGAIGPQGRLSTTLKVKSDDLPAQCHLSAGGGARQSFMVTEDSPSKWWFHITADGTMAGPYGKDDVHTETGQDADITVPAGQRMIVR